MIGLIIGIQKTICSVRHGHIYECQRRVFFRLPPGQLNVFWNHMTAFEEDRWTHLHSHSRDQTEDIYPIPNIIRQTERDDRSVWSVSHLWNWWFRKRFSSQADCWACGACTNKKQIISSTLLTEGNLLFCSRGGRGGLPTRSWQVYSICWYSTWWQVQLAFSQIFSFLSPFSFNMRN